MTAQDTSIPHDWYHRSFDALYPVVYAHRTVEAAKDEALFSVEQTRLTPSDSVLDLCCGNGRHMAHLETRCAHLVGLDYSPHLLELATESLGTHASFVRADMRHQPFDNAFDVVMNYFTSMGYFNDPEENRSVVRGVTRALKPGGRFFIDYMHADWAVANLQAETSRTYEGHEIRETRWVDKKRNRINKTTVVARAEKQISESHESVKLYSTDEFAELLTGGGLTITAMYGDYQGGPVSLERPRMIAVGEKTN